MVIYKKAAADFLSDVDSNTIGEEIERQFLRQQGWVPSREIAPWNNSLRFMETIVRNSKVSGDCGVLVEYQIPSTAKRIDFIIAGIDDQGRKNLIIIELKQWQSAGATRMDGIVTTLLGRGIHSTAHPSYQAHSYKILLTDFNENVEKKAIHPHSCAYLHNYRERNPEPLRDKVYETVVSDSPLFFKHDPEKLEKFIKKHVGGGRGMEILYEIEKGRLRPGKKLIDHVCSMFKGNTAFTLIDNQKVAYERALSIASQAKAKTVVVIKGGPGTGKSVISVNLLGALLKRKHHVVFVAPNAAFRNVMITTLAQQNSQQRLKNLFYGSSSFVGMKANFYSTIVVDEAHRLKGRGAYGYKGENQVEDIIHTARTTILFMDDSQQVRPEDIGSVAETRRIAKKFGAEFVEMELDAQYRCAGAEGFVNWLDTVLQIRETGNYDGWDRKDFDFIIYDNPNEVYEAVKSKQNHGFNSRMLAGYAWEWTSEKHGNANGEVKDVTIDEFNFRMPWNARSARTTWAINPAGVKQIGCIHTSQGLEFDYVGVIIGPDLGFDPKSNSFKASYEKYKDVMGKRGMADKPEQLSKYIKNIYKTLMSRALRGCYIYICDKDVAEHFKKSLQTIDNRREGVR